MSEISLAAAWRMSSRSRFQNAMHCSSLPALPRNLEPGCSHSARLTAPFAMLLFTLNASMFPCPVPFPCLRLSSIFTLLFPIRLLKNSRKNPITSVGQLCEKDENGIRVGND